MNNIHNVLIIPFSMRNPDWEKKAYGGIEANREPWFAYRAYLFRSTLLKSIKCQSKPVNRVYVLLDASDSALYEKYLSNPILTPIYCGDYVQLIEDDLHKVGLTHDIAVSRIDSDDVVSKDYFLQLSKQLAVNPKELTVACKGYRCNFNSIQSVFYGCSPFLTQLRTQCTDQNLIYIINYPHQNLRNIVHQQNHNAEWMQVIHSHNVINNFAGDVNYLPDTVNVAWYAEPLAKVNADWFHTWAGFEMPPPTLLRTSL